MSSRRNAYASHKSFKFCHQTAKTFAATLANATRCSTWSFLSSSLSSAASLDRHRSSIKPTPALLQRQLPASSAAREVAGSTARSAAAGQCGSACRTDDSAHEDSQHTTVALPSMLAQVAQRGHAATTDAAHVQKHNPTPLGATMHSCSSHGNRLSSVSNPRELLERHRSSATAGWLPMRRI